MFCGQDGFKRKNARAYKRSHYQKKNVDGDRTFSNMMFMKILAGYLFTLIALSTPTFADRINKSFFSGVAVEGTDVVAYFTQNRAVAGKAEFSHMWKGAKWLFSSAANRDLFAKSPEKYEPQYGGFWAYAVGNNYTAGIDPQSWAIINGKLYLNYDPDIKKKWDGNRDTFIKQGDKNWPALSK